jgi:LysM repeat protein
MIKKTLLIAVGILVLSSTLGAQSVTVELANLREDVRLLTQRVGEMQLRIEVLERENGELRAKTAGAAQNAATIAQLNDAIAEIQRSIRAGDAATKAETLQIVSGQIEKLAARTNAALEAISRNRTPAPAPTFSDDYPKEGVPHVVQKGETLAVIARKYGAKLQDIVNANRIEDPSKIQVGQTLFIPGGK